MSTQSGGQGTTVGTVTDFPDILCVIEGTLVVPTEDATTGSMAWHGLKYLLPLEFARQHPALALLYELDIQFLQQRTGSRLFDFKALVKLKNRVKAEIRKAGLVATLGVILAIPPTIDATIHTLEHIVKATEVRLQVDLPQSPPTIELKDIRIADNRDVFKPDGEFDLS
ncbi:MAG TPA: hypothetical protein VEI95_07615 [Acidobacteriota bacterium]|nr:hypothetical protein [Acidobacteriota bacterium]